MASPSPSLNSTATLRKPRRKRHGSEEGATLRQQPQRKKSRLNSDVSDLQANGHVNGTAHGTKQANGHVTSASNGVGSLRNIPYRGITEDPRATKDDGTVTLTKNDKFSIKHLPALPRSVRDTKNGDFRGSGITATGYALALTRTQALVWNYRSTAVSPTSKVFSLTYPTKSHEPIPVGTLVSSGSVSETGLVVVHPVNGKISFWENVENADALNLFEKRRNGAQGDCGGMLSGETVTTIEDAGSAGFVLTFSSGRTAQVLVRDSQSRPAITVNFLRGRASGSGFFGGLKSVFASSAFLKPIAAARCRPLQSRDASEMILVNEDGLFQSWQLSWSAQPHMLREIDARAPIEAAIKPSAYTETQAQHVKVIDFVIVSDASGETDCLLLVNYILAGSSTYALMELDLDERAVSFRRTIVLHSYVDTIVDLASWKPRMWLPSGGHTACVVFENAITVVTLASAETSPSTQLLMDTGQVPEPYQETVHFRSGSAFMPCGVSAEGTRDGQGSSSAIIFIKDYGLVRLAIEQLPLGAIRDRAAGTSAKSKIEQAVFFGSSSSNPLDLMRTDGTTFSVEEIEQAAVEISQDVLTSDSPHIPQVAASMKDHLEGRARNLENLINYILSLSSNISRRTRWLLRFDGERLAACQKVWALYDELQSSNPGEVRMLYESVFVMHERDKTELHPDLGETDCVRYWFTKDVTKMHLLFAWTTTTIDHLEKLNTLPEGDGKVTEMVNEGSAYIIEGLIEAYSFRNDTAARYGLEADKMQDGFLIDGYEGLPEFWTSAIYMIWKIPDHFQRVKDAVLAAKAENPNAVEMPAVQTLISSSLSLAEATCRGFSERIRYESARSDEEGRTMAKTCKDYFLKLRTGMITSLVDIEKTMFDEAADMARDYGDLEALVHIVKVKKEFIADLLSSQDLEVQASARKAQDVLEYQEQGYFKAFGSAYGEATFPDSSGNELLHQAHLHPREVTTYLKMHRSRGKVSWINDVINCRDFSDAARSLTEVANEQESRLWSKKVELSIAKLALASIQPKEVEEIQDKVKSRTLKNIKLVEIQEKLQAHVRPFLFEAIDEEAELKLAMETFGKRVHKRLRHLAELLEHGLKELINHHTMSAEQLIDVLTLMDTEPCPSPEHDVSGQLTYLALLALKNSGLQNDQQRSHSLLRIIWMRCFVSDDWQHINDTGAKADSGAMADLQATTLFKTLSEGDKNDLFEDAPGVRLLPATQCLEAGTKTQELLARFQDQGLCNAIARDNSHQSQELHDYLHHQKLEHWVSATKNLVDRRMREAKEANTAAIERLGKAVGALEEEEAFAKVKEREAASGGWLEAVQRSLGL